MTRKAMWRRARQGLRRHAPCFFLAQIPSGESGHRAGRGQRPQNDGPAHTAALASCSAPGSVRISPRATATAALSPMKAPV